MAPLAKNLVVSYDEFLKIKEESNEILEYIDGVICMSPSPSCLLCTSPNIIRLLY